MAEERVLYELVTSCRAGQSYGAWTSMRALLQRRYIAPGSRGNATKGVELIMSAMQEAAVPFVDASVAAGLSDALLGIMRRDNIPVHSDNGGMWVCAMGGYFAGVVTSSDDAGLSLGSEVVYSGANGAAAVKGRLGAWFSAHIYFIESVLTSVGDEPPNRGIQDLDLQYFLFKWRFISVQRLIVWFENRGGASGITCSLGEPAGLSNPNDVITWTLSKALVRLMQVSVAGIHADPGHIKISAQLLCKHTPSVVEQQWVMATHIYTALSYCERYTGPLASNYTQRLYCRSVSPMMCISRTQALVAAYIEVGGLAQRHLTSPWMCFIHSFFILCKYSCSCGSFRNITRTQEEKEAYLAVCDQLCALYKQTLEELPGYHWREVAEAFWF